MTDKKPLRMVQVLGVLFEEFGVGDAQKAGNTWRRRFEDDVAIVLTAVSSSVILELVRERSGEDASSDELIMRFVFCRPDCIYAAPLPLWALHAGRHSKMRDFFFRSVVLFAACVDAEEAPGLRKAPMDEFANPSVVH